MSNNKHYIYHITHFDNLRNIIQQEKLYSKNGNKNRFTNIAHQTVQERRNKKVPVSPFGYLHDYVPFYFCQRSPTLYTISQGNVLATKMVKNQ